MSKFMNKHTDEVQRVHQSDGPAETRGNPVFNNDTNELWYSQKQAAEDMGVSPNVLSKHLDGKLPKLDR